MYTYIREYNFFYDDVYVHVHLELTKCWHTSKMHVNYKSDFYETERHYTILTEACRRRNWKIKYGETSKFLFFKLFYKHFYIRGVSKIIQNLIPGIYSLRRLYFFLLFFIIRIKRNDVESKSYREKLKNRMKIVIIKIIIANVIKYFIAMLHRKSPFLLMIFLMIIISFTIYIIMRKKKKNEKSSCSTI